MSIEYTFKKIHEKFKTYHEQGYHMGHKSVLDCGCIFSMVETKYKNTVKSQLDLCQYHHKQSKQIDLQKEFGISKSKDWKSFLA